MNILVTVLILVVLIIAIVAVVVFLRNKKSVTSQQPPITPMSSPNRPEVRHDADEPIPTLSSSRPSAQPQAQQPQPNYLDNAQQLINQQRYDDAEQELKRGLSKAPNDSDLLIKLLNVYAIDSRHDDFHQLYQKIQSQGNPSTINQASRLKNLIDAEQAATTKANTTAATSAPTAEILPDDDDDNGLDFDLSLGDSNSDDDDLIELDTGSDANKTSQQTTSQADDDLTLSFDDLESQLLTDGDTSSNLTAKTEESSDNDTLELTLDGLEGVNDEAKAELVTQTEPALSLDTDGTDSRSTNSNAEQSITLDIADMQESDNSSDTDDNLHFDWGLEDDETKKETTSDKPVSEDAQATSDSSDSEDLQLDWGLEDKPDSGSNIADSKAATHIAPVDSSSDSTDNEELALNIDDSEEVTSLEQPVDELTFDELAVDNATADAPSHDEHQADQEAELSFEDFNISDDHADTDSTETALSSEEDAIADFDFGLDTEQDKEESAKDEPTIDDGFDDFSAIEAAELGDNLDSNLDDNLNERKEDSQLSDDSSTNDTNELSINETLEDTTAPADSTKGDEVLGSGVEDTLSQLDALNFDDSYDTADTTDSTKDEPVTDNAPVSDEVSQEAATTAPVSTPAIPKADTEFDQSTPVVAPDAEQFSSDFGFVSELDGPQVTLTLAVQYLELGEYESAKRLLNEVIQHGDSQQQDLAQELLAKTV